MQTKRNLEASVSQNFFALCHIQVWLYRRLNRITILSNFDQEDVYKSCSLSRLVLSPISRKFVINREANCVISKNDCRSNESWMLVWNVLYRRRQWHQLEHNPLITEVQRASCKSKIGLIPRVFRDSIGWSMRHSSLRLQRDYLF